MRMWLPYISNFGHVIWERLTDGATVERSGINTYIIRLDIPFEGLRLFGFVDDTGSWTNTSDL